MSWIKQNSNLYTHSDAPFSLQYIGSTWYLVDNRDQSKAIPFSDIFNNPVYAIDLSNQDVLVNSLSSTTTISAGTVSSGTHLRSEGANTPATPGHSFKNEISSGLYRESAGVLALAILGTKIVQFDSNGITANLPYWKIVDQKTNGTRAQAGTAGSFIQRNLNTTIGTNSIPGSSLASNQFSLPSGTYRIYSSNPVYLGDRIKAKLRNVTDSTDVLIGSSEVAPSSGGQSSSFISGIFTIASTKTFEIQQYTQTAGSYFGLESSSGVAEIYGQVELWKLA